MINKNRLGSSDAGAGWYIMMLIIVIMFSFGIEDIQNKTKMMKIQQQEQFSSISECKTYNQLEKTFNIQKYNNGNYYTIGINPIWVSPKGNVLEEPVKLKVDTETELKEQLTQLGYLCRENNTQK